MARYRIVFKQSVARDFRKILPRDVKRLLRRIEKLAVHPRGQGSMKLTGGEYYRVRLGAYRIVYEVRDDCLVVVVIKVAHRSKAYD